MFVLFSQTAWEQGKGGEGEKEPGMRGHCGPGRRRLSDVRCFKKWCKSYVNAEGEA